MRIAECSIREVYSECVKHIHIENVYVNQHYRNQNYCKLLILNIIDFFGKHKYLIEANINNKPVYFCYKNIFGYPFNIKQGNAYFCIDLNLG